MGEISRSGESRVATLDELALYGRAQSLQSLQRVPVLQRADDPHEYLFFALFDGSGQDATDRDVPLTNIGALREQVLKLEKTADSRIAGRYVEGIGTQNNVLARSYDGIVAHTWDEKIESAYRALAEQVWEWQQRDPQVRVALVGAGYSRGAVLSAGLARLVDEHGIANPIALSFGRDTYGNLTVESSRPPLLPPGQTAQAVVLLDPVATSMPANFDARLPPSVISRFAIAAADEQRTAFPHQTIIAPGISDDRRALNLLLPGGHSNVGGGNRESGLETGAFNVVVDQLNGYLDRPLFTHRQLPADPAMYTVYQVRGPTAVPGLDGDGLRDLRLELANCKIVDPCRDAEPVDEALASRFEYRALRPSAPVPRLPPGPASPTLETRVSAESPSPPAPSDPAHPDHGLLLQIRAGVGQVDRALGRDYDETSERLSRSLLAANRAGGNDEPIRVRESIPTTALTRVDHVVVGADGRHAFAVQGDLLDPAHRRIHVVLDAAVGTPVEQSDARLAVASWLAEQQAHAMREQATMRTHDDPQRTMPAP